MLIPPRQLSNLGPLRRTAPVMLVLLGATIAHKLETQMSGPAQTPQKDILFPHLPISHRLAPELAKNVWTNSPAKNAEPMAS